MKVKKTVKTAKIKMTDAPRVEAPLVGRRAMLSRHAEQSAQKGAAAATGGLRGRRAFAHAHRFPAGGGK